MKQLVAAFLSLLSIAASAQSSLDLSDLAVGQTSRKAIEVNGYDRHFSITLPTSYDTESSYPAVLFFHGCMCRPTHTEELILSYLDWVPRLAPYSEDFIVIRMSAFSQKKPQRPSSVENGGARGMWLWHEGLESERDDYQFVDTLLEELLASAEINIDASNIFGVGHSSGAIFLMSYVLGGPVDMAVNLNDRYTFKAISVTGGSTLRKGIVDFKENTPQRLPSVLHIQGERDQGLWFNGRESGKRGIDFLEFVSAANGTTIVDGLRETIHGRTYSAWDENVPANPSTLERWAAHLNLEYSGFEEYAQYFIYNFRPVSASENLLYGMRIKDCGHRVAADSFQAEFFRVFAQRDGNSQAFEDVISRDSADMFCQR